MMDSQFFVDKRGFGVIFIFTLIFVVWVLLI